MNRDELRIGFGMRASVPERQSISALGFGFSLLEIECAVRGVLF